MPTTEEALDVAEILFAADVEPSSIFELRRYVHCHIDRRTELETLISDWDPNKFSNENKAETRRGIALWVLGKVEEAIPVLEEARQSREKSLFLGLSYLDVDRKSDALEPLKEAHSAEPSDLKGILAYAEARMKTGDLKGGGGMLDRLAKKHEDDADVHYLRGLCHDFQGERNEAMDAYDRALVQEPGHPRALFRLAYIHDLRGEDATAMEYYQQLRKLRPVHVNTMINLGVLYEDRGEYERAVECYRSILDYFPNHSRARQYYMDVVAALNMYYDEDAARREAKLQQLLAQPVTDISFSPRVRNALEKLGIETLGDLCKKSEDDLLTIPNFGKTSLREVRECLTSKGLNISAGEAPGGFPAAAAMAPDMLTRPLTDLEWSGRLAKIFETLKWKTIGDIMQRSEKELLLLKNFGPTSVEEISKALESLGVSLRAE